MSILIFLSPLTFLQPKRSFGQFLSQETLILQW